MWKYNAEFIPDDLLFSAANQLTKMSRPPKSVTMGKESWLQAPKSVIMGKESWLQAPKSVTMGKESWLRV